MIEQSNSFGIDLSQTDRSPTHMYRTAQLAELWTHQKGGFFHDGRFANLQDVIERYNLFLKLGLTDSVLIKNKRGIYERI